MTIPTIKEQLAELEEVLYFATHLADVIEFLRNEVCGGRFQEEPQQLYSLLAVTDFAASQMRDGKIDRSLAFLQTLPQSLNKEGAV